MYTNVAGAPVTFLFMMSTLFAATIGNQTSWSVMICWALMTSCARLTSSFSPRAASSAAVTSGLDQPLKFCEPHYKDAGKRVFGVKLQGKPVIEHLDLFAKVGQNKALDHTFPDVKVTNGWLDVDFVFEVEFPSIAAIVVSGPAATRKINCGGPAFQLAPDKETPAAAKANIAKRKLKGFYLSISVDRSRKCAIILFSDQGGVDIESLARDRPDALRRAAIPVLMDRVPPFMIRDLLSGAPAEIGDVINRLYSVFCRKDALLAEINPLVMTPAGLYAADAKLVIDDNALRRQGIAQNRDLTEREREAEKHGFSYVELKGDIGVIGNGAGLTMATLDLIQYYDGSAANFLDVGGGADQERVMHAVRLVAADPSVRVIVVNLLGGITRCDEVARGIIAAGVSQPVIVRLAGTNEKEGREILRSSGYQMLDSMEEAVRAAVEATR